MAVSFTPTDATAPMLTLVAIKATVVSRYLLMLIRVLSFVIILRHPLAQEIPCRPAASLATSARGG